MAWNKAPKKRGYRKVSCWLDIFKFADGYVVVLARHNRIEYEKRVKSADQLFKAIVTARKRAGDDEYLLLKMTPAVVDYRW